MYPNSLLINIWWIKVKGSIHFFLLFYELIDIAWSIYMDNVLSEYNKIGKQQPYKNSFAISWRGKSYEIYLDDFHSIIFSMLYLFI